MMVRTPAESEAALQQAADRLATRFDPDRIIANSHGKRNTRAFSPHWIHAASLPVFQCISLLLLFLLSCRGRYSGPGPLEKTEPCPPDVSRCTRVEIRYLPSLSEYLFRTNFDRSVLSPAELAYVRSQDPIIVEREDRLRALSQEISMGIYHDTVTMGVPGMPLTAEITCHYENGERISLALMEAYVVAEGTTWFHYAESRLNLVKYAKGVWPLEQRALCASNLRRLAHHWRGRRAASTWCDDTVKALLEISRAPEYTKIAMRHFGCPAMGQGRCHYAMNPECKRDSPADTVLLFETTSGWNQHGGPELFTFNNHDPRGGLVLLHDRTVRFIRTEEELMTLRWR